MKEDFSCSSGGAAAKEVPACGHAKNTRKKRALPVSEPVPLEFEAEKSVGKMDADGASQRKRQACKNPSDPEHLPARRTGKQPAEKNSAGVENADCPSASGDLQACPEGSGSFKGYLSRIRAAKLAADSIMECSGAGKAAVDTPNAVLELLWEMLFDRLCDSQRLEASEFNAFAGVLQKLVSARAQMVNAGPRRGGQGISRETLEKIEKQLNLM